MSLFFVLKFAIVRFLPLVVCFFLSSCMSSPETGAQKQPYQKTFKTEKRKAKQTWEPLAVQLSQDPLKTHRRVLEKLGARGLIGKEAAELPGIPEGTIPPYLSKREEERDHHVRARKSLENESAKNIMFPV